MAIVPINVTTRGYLQGGTLAIAVRGYLNIFVVIEGGGAGGDFNLGIISDKPLTDEEEEDVILAVIQAFLRLWD